MEEAFGLSKAELQPGETDCRYFLSSHYMLRHAVSVFVSVSVCSMDVHPELHGIHVARSCAVRHSKRGWITRPHATQRSLDVKPAVWWLSTADVASANWSGGAANTRQGRLLRGCMHDSRHNMQDQRSPQRTHVPHGWTVESIGPVVCHSSEPQSR